MVRFHNRVGNVGSVVSAKIHQQRKGAWGKGGTKKRGLSAKAYKGIGSNAIKILSPSSAIEMFMSIIIISILNIAFV
jgi:hypothetical protein